MAMTQFKQEEAATLMHQLSKGYSDDELAALAGLFLEQAR